MDGRQGTTSHSAQRWVLNVCWRANLMVASRYDQQALWAGAVLYGLNHGDRPFNRQAK